MAPLLDSRPCNFGAAGIQAEPGRAAEAHNELVVVAHMLVAEVDIAAVAVVGCTSAVGGMSIVWEAHMPVAGLGEP